MRSRWILGLSFLFGLCAPQSVAQPPDLMNFQGVARDAADQPLIGNHDMVFRFYDTEVGAFNEILVDTHDAINGNPVNIDDGMFNVVLGGGIVADGAGPGTYTSLRKVFRDYHDLWVSIQVDDEVLAPRTRMMSAGFALNTDMVDGLDAASGPVAGELCALDVNAKFPNSTLYTGTGNGLDADLLDGYQSTHFQDAGNLAAGTLDPAHYSAYLDLASEGYLDDNASGDLMTQAQGDARFVSTAAANSVTSAMIVDGSVSAVDLQDGAALSEILDDDGAGSGLDSDLLDGQQGSFYRNAGNINAGTLAGARFSSYSDLSSEGYLDNNSSTDLMTRVQADGRFLNVSESNSVTSAMIVNGTVSADDLADGVGSGVDSDLLDGEQGSFYRDAVNINAGTLADARFSSYNDLFSEGYLDNNTSSDLLTRAQADGRFLNEGQTIDADTLDGLDGSQYLRSDTGDTFTSGNLTLAAGTKLLVGTSQSTHNLVVESADSETMRLIGPFGSGRGARLYFGDSDFVYLEEDSGFDDKLKIRAERGVEIFANSGALAGSFYGTGFEATQDIWLGEASGSDDDSLYFDRGESEYIRWEDAEDRFWFSNDLHTVFTMTANRFHGLSGTTYFVDPDHTGLSAKLAGSLTVNGGLDVLGSKNFIQPHPVDPSKEIRFASLEGNESGTYFRGSSRLAGGSAVIQVPEEFRLASEAEGISVQLTPRGPDADLWVDSVGLDRIVVQGFDDVEFDFFVTGVRRGFRDLQIIRENRSFVPDKRGLPFGEQFPEAYRSILVDNGILNPDHTPNEETAARLGWTLNEPSHEELANARSQLQHAGPAADPSIAANAAQAKEQGTSRPDSPHFPLPVTRVQSTAGHMNVVLDRGADDEARFSIFRDGAAPGDLSAEVLRVDEKGNVYAMGSFRPSAMDVAEHFAVSEAVEPGDLLVADPDIPRRFRRSRTAADPSVIGIVSADPGVLLGSGLLRIAAARPDLATRLEQARNLGDVELEEQIWTELEAAFKNAYAPVALSGTVLCKVDASYGAVHTGDLLTTSSTPGFAARADDPQPGTIVGKALEPLQTGIGTIRVLVMLR
ncbi:MAG: hypothetical protein GY722_12805 [bacterium]|nr:hypothetical protein [bacterium]